MGQGPGGYMQPIPWQLIKVNFDPFKMTLTKFVNFMAYNKF